MTLKQYEKLTWKLLDRWIPRLKLKHWTIRSRVVDCCEVSTTAKGQATISYGHDAAKLEFRNDLAFDDLRDAVVHELVHCVFGRTLMAHEELGKTGELSKSAWHLYEQQWMLNHEHDISRMTDALCAMVDDDDLRPEEE